VGEGGGEAGSHDLFIRMAFWSNFRLVLSGILDVQSIHIHRFDGEFDQVECLKFQIARSISSDGLVQLGLMWRRVEPDFGIGSDRRINP
jgi:hypothetical protein